MKFGIFLQHYFPYGGLQRDAVRLAKAALEEGDTPVLIVSTWEGPKPNGIQIVELRAGGKSNHAKARNFAKACEDTYAKYNLDTAICFSRVPGTPFHFCGDPCYKERFVRTKPQFLKFLPRYRYLLEAENALFGETSNTHVFYLAESETPAYKKYYPLEESRFTLLPPWLKRPKHFDSSLTELKSRQCSELGIPVDSELLLFVGSDFHRKGLDRAIEALAGMKSRPNLHLVACGQDNPQKFEALAKELNIAERVHIIGPRDDIPEWMAISDLLIHPARQETAGMVLLEALTYKLPVLCTENCGYAAAVEEAGCSPVPHNISTNNLSIHISMRVPASQETSDRIEAWLSTHANFKTANSILDLMRLSSPS
jgi:UDP-glucose:(heptosyl)LPS alpha-1,3-glucosyltransferase